MKFEVPVEGRRGGDCMKVFSRLAGLFLLLPVMLLAQGGPVGLFDARISVEGGGADERQEATRTGLEQVLERITGRRDVLEEPEAKELLENAERYLQQYGYDQVRDEEGRVERLLNLRFDGGAIERALVERNIPVWSPEDRPRTLVWLAVDRGDGRELIGGDRGQAEQQLLRQSAAGHGLPVLLPLMDLEDQQAIRTSDLWGGFRDPIRAASERYRTEAVLVGRLSERNGRWQGRWLLFWNNDTHEITASDESLDAIMAAGVKGASGYLAQRLAGVPATGAGGVVYIRFEGMNELAEYAWAQQLFENTRGVVRADPYRIYDEFTDFRLQLDTDADRVLRALQDSRRVAEAEVGSSRKRPEEVSGRSPDYFFRMR